MKNSEQITAIVTRLHRYNTTDGDERFSATVRRWVEDPLRPTADKEGLRINPILVLLILLALLAGATFLVFSLFQL